MARRWVAAAVVAQVVRAGFTYDEAVTRRELFLAQASYCVSPLNVSWACPTCLRTPEVYGKALAACHGSMVELRGTLLSNRAACHLKRRRWAPCIEDCTAALELDDARAKAWSRISRPARTARSRSATRSPRASASARGPATR